MRTYKTWLVPVKQSAVLGRAYDEVSASSDDKQPVQVLLPGDGNWRALTTAEAQLLQTAIGEALRWINKHKKEGTAE